MVALAKCEWHNQVKGILMSTRYNRNFDSGSEQNVGCSISSTVKSGQMASLFYVYSTFHRGDVVEIQNTYRQLLVVFLLPA